MNKIEGLSNKEVEEQIKKGNINKTQQDNLKSNKQIIFDNVFTLFNLYNLIIAIALICVKAYTNVFFFLIITINVLIGIIQEIHGRNLVKKLSIFNKSKATVIRNGQEKKIEIEEIVLGDTIILSQGDQIPSDSYVIEGEVEVNEALLTGESDLILKNENDKLLSGSYVVSGKCYAVVEKVGEENFANKIISAAKKQKPNNSELINSMKKVTKFTSFAIIPVGIILFIQAYITRQTDLTQAVVATSAALLGMLPKGLLLLITISLEAGVINLAKKRVLVQDLYSIESLAHIDTICLDKTGTIEKIKLEDIHAFLSYLANEHHSKPTTRARKVSSIRVFFKYLSQKANLIDKNPAQNLETPKLDRRLPKYLTLDDSKKLLTVASNEENRNAKRDYAIITLFLNCGMRLSELVGINLTDISFDDCKLNVIGKGNKERTIYLNKACMKAISEYLNVRPKESIKYDSKNALFLSERRERISRRTVQHIVYKELETAGLDSHKYSVHKLRHTAATLMYQYGNVDIRALQELLGHESISTTEIYTHVNDERVRNAVESNPLSEL